MKLERTKRFQKSYQKLPQHIQEQVNEKLKRLLQNPRHPSLRVKKIQGEKENLYELSVTMNYRLTFQFQSDIYILRDVGTHKDILGR